MKVSQTSIMLQDFQFLESEHKYQDMFFEIE
jgi:hypothetical protein